jgi:hypothetical protein
MGVCCPKCGSNQITSNKRGYSGCSGCFWALLMFPIWPIAMLMGFSGSNTVLITCLNCGKQWRPGGGFSIVRVGIVSLLLVSALVAVAPFLSSSGSQSSPPPSVAAKTRDRPTADTGTGPLKTFPERAIEPAKPIERLNLANYYRVDDGMTYEQVKRILGPASEESLSASAGQGTEFATKMVMLTWKGHWGASANITFQDGRVTAKGQFGLPQGEVTPDIAPDPPPTPVAIATPSSIPAEKSAERKAEAEKALQKLREETKADQAPAYDYRTWSDAAGKHQTEAAFVGQKGATVTLHKRSGDDVQVNIFKLSDADREWLQAERDRAKRKP